MRPYGQKRMYGKYITRVIRYMGAGKVKITTGVKNRKLGRKVRVEDKEDMS